MDLALLLDGEIRDLAKKSGLAGVDSLARPDLVLQLRAMDIGKSGMPALVSSISALSSTITALTVEMVSLREDRDREVREMKATIDGLVAKMIHLEEGGSPNLIAQSTTPSTTYSSVAVVRVLSIWKIDRFSCAICRSTDRARIDRSESGGETIQNKSIDLEQLRNVVQCMFRTLVNSFSNERNQLRYLVSSFLSAIFLPK